MSKEMLILTLTAWLRRVYEVFWPACLRHVGPADLQYSYFSLGCGKDKIFLWLTIVVINCNCVGDLQDGIVCSPIA